MTNNDVLRRLRYIFDYDDNAMIRIYGQTGQEASREQICDWLKPEEDPAYRPCRDTELARFLNGLIIEKRGRRDSAQPAPENRLTNNMIFTKLKIALDLKSEDVLEILRSGGLTISQHELTAFFRRPGHKHYRECKDQVLRNFLKGLQLKFRGTENSQTHTIWN